MVMIVGHRGARNLWPENSLGGFRRLLALGVEAVEFDVQLTRDGEFVVIHDPTLERTTYGRGAIRDLRRDEVVTQRLKPAAATAAPLLAGAGAGGAAAASAPTAATATAAVANGAAGTSGAPGTRDDFADERVPALEEVIALFAPTPLELHIEIKTDALGVVDPRTIGRLVKLVHDHGMATRAVLTCFVPEVLERVLAAWPGGRVLASLDHRSAEMLGGLPNALARYAAMPGCLVAVQKDLLRASGTQCHDALGADRLGVWVLNEPAEFAAWAGVPMRQLTTDRPDLALSARAAGDAARAMASAAAGATAGVTSGPTSRGLAAAPPGGERI